jgi:hypothetical protein
MIEALFALLLGYGEPSLTETGVPSPTNDAASFTEASAAFDVQLRRLHPPGSEVAALEAALAEEGFVVEAPGEARLERPGFLCLLDWTVRWTEAGGLIETVEGEHAGVCM